MSMMGLKIICELNTPSERAHFELQNATFTFEIGPTYLKLWLAKENAHFQRKTAVYRLGKLAKMGWKILRELSTPSERAHFELLVALSKFEIGPSYPELRQAEYSVWQAYSDSQYFVCVCVYCLSAGFCSIQDIWLFVKADRSWPHLPPQHHFL